MKSLTLMLLGMLFASVAFAQTSSKECFTLNSQGASEAGIVCFVNEKYAEVYSSDKHLLEKVAFKNTSSIVNLDHGVYWNLVVSLGEGQSFAVKATRNSGAALNLDWVKNIKTGQMFTVYKPSRPQPRGCNGRGRCI